MVDGMTVDGSERVMGPWMRRLGEYLRGLHLEEIFRVTDGWSSVADVLRAAAELLGGEVRALSAGMEESSLSADAAVRAAGRLADLVSARETELRAGVVSLDELRARLRTAAEWYAASMARLPRLDELSDGAAAVDAAERAAAIQIEDLNRYYEASGASLRLLAEPLYIGYPEWPTAYPVGSRSRVVALTQEWRKYHQTLNTLHREGWGHVLADRLRDQIREERLANEPEWDRQSARWVDADGAQASPALYGAVQVDGSWVPLRGLGGSWSS